MKRQSIQTLVSLLSALAFAPFGVACSPEEERPRPPPPGSSDRDGGLPTPGTIFETGPCTDGDVKECSIILGVHNDIVSCFHGVQVCRDGVWGPCDEGGEIIETAADVPGVVGSGQATIDGGAPPAP